jgi:hypothetical protein
VPISCLAHSLKSAVDIDENEPGSVKSSSQRLVTRGGISGCEWGFVNNSVKNRWPTVMTKAFQDKGKHQMTANRGHFPKGYLHNEEESISNWRTKR